jgi:hypothetical protein
MADWVELIERVAQLLQQGDPPILTEEQFEILQPLIDANVIAAHARRMVVRDREAAVRAEQRAVIYRNRLARRAEEKAVRDQQVVDAKAIEMAEHIVNAPVVEFGRLDDEDTDTPVEDDEDDEDTDTPVEPPIIVHRRNRKKKQCSRHSKKWSAYRSASRHARPTRFYNLTWTISRGRRKALDALMKDPSFVNPIPLDWRTHTHHDQQAVIFEDVTLTPVDDLNTRFYFAGYYRNKTITDFTTANATKTIMYATWFLSSHYMKHVLTQLDSDRVQSDTIYRSTLNTYELLTSIGITADMPFKTILHTLRNYHDLHPIMLCYFQRD